MEKLPRIDWPNMKFDNEAKQIESVVQEVAARYLQQILKCAQEVVWFDWSDNDPDAVAAVERLRACVNGRTVTCPNCQGEGDNCNHPYHSEGRQ